MKKIVLAIMIVALLCACLCGCGESQKTVEDLKEKGSLTVATSPDFPPFELLESDGTVSGIEIEIMQKVCDELGVTLKIEQMDFDSVLPGVSAKKYDAAASGISIDEKRSKNVLFCDPFCLAAQAIVVPAGSDITCKADLEGKLISVQTSTTAEAFCMNNGYNVSSFAANSDAELALTTGKVDAWVIDDLTAAEMVKAYNEENPGALVVLDEAMTTEPYAFAFSFGSEPIVKEINKILKQMLEDGTIAAIFEKYDAPFTSPLQ